MLDPSQIRAISFDLDDTLWPIWPAIHRAEEVLLLFLKEHAPKTAIMFPTPEALRALRVQVEREHPEWRHDLAAMRKASIRLALRQAGDDENLAIPAFDLFFAQRQRVDLYSDTLPALQQLSARWPLVAITNGNADIQKIGIAAWFQDSWNVQRAGVAKPDPHIFACAAQGLQLPLSAMLHVGDDPLLDVVAARDAGMHAIWLNRSGIDWPVADQPPPVTVSSLLSICTMLMG